MPAADLILAGAQVRTLDPERPSATAVAVHDGTVTAVGTADDVRDWRGPGTEVVELHGAHSYRAWSTPTAIRCGGWTWRPAPTCPA
ncbi:hypothetical protein GCM10010521_59810 [Streptomyces rameus]|uniref:Amidohydrolase 3 domain-containing protein n=1 Tax=Streptomyces rameus TaxID=68261 RepID=A0ABN3V0G0_9ACTN